MSLYSGGRSLVNVTGWVEQSSESLHTQPTNNLSLVSALKPSSNQNVCHNEHEMESLNLHNIPAANYEPKLIERFDWSGSFDVFPLNSELLNLSTVSEVPKAQPEGG